MAEIIPRDEQGSHGSGAGGDRVGDEIVSGQTTDFLGNSSFLGKARWYRTYLGFASRKDFVALPYWFAILVASAPTAALWLPECKCFTLRTLLVATTLVAVVLGLAVYFAHPR